MKDSYTLNGLYFRKVRNFWIVYHDAKKASANYGIYCNAGFFANFKNNKGKIFTLPVANLVCDPWQIPVEGRDEVMKHWINGKLRFSTDDPHTTQFRGRMVSTLVVQNGIPSVKRLFVAPIDCQYAISGIPCVQYGKPATMDDVLIEGWDYSPMYGTMRNWIGVRNGEIWLINGSTKTSNYLIPDKKTGISEFWGKVKSEGFSDILSLDGGGSAFFSDQNGVKKTLENRRVNNVIVFS